MQSGSLQLGARYNRTRCKRDPLFLRIHFFPHLRIQLIKFIG